MLKGKPSLLTSFPAGAWNPNAVSLKRTADEVSIKKEPGSESPNKKIKVENGEIPLLTEQDIINAMSGGKVNVKEFGKKIRKMFPGPENKKLMFVLVKKLCRKVDDEHMELKA